MVNSCRRITTEIPRVLEQDHDICSRELYAILKFSNVLVGCERDGVSCHKTSSDHVAEIAQHIQSSVRSTNS